MSPLVASIAFGRHPGAAAVIAAVIHARRAFGLSVYLRLPVETFIVARRILRWRPPTGSAGHGDQVFFGHVVMPGGAVGTSTEVPPRLVTVFLRQRPMSRRSHDIEAVVSPSEIAGPFVP